MYFLISSAISLHYTSKFVVAIGFDGKNYLWKTRKNKVLEYSTKGAFHFFVNEEGSVYLKIDDLSKMGGDEKKYLYLEPINLGFSTITYNVIFVLHSNNSYNSKD